MPKQTKVKVGRHTYVVTHDDKGVLYIKANNAVSGWKPIALNGRVAKKVLQVFGNR